VSEKKKSTTTAARNAAPKLKPREISADDLATAARDLRHRLNAIVAELDLGKKRGMTDAQTWATISFCQRAPARRGSSRLSGTELALRAYVDRTTHEDDRRMLGIMLSLTALALARGEVDPAAALQYCKEREGTGELGPGTLEQLKRALQGARSELSAYKKAYGVLAEGAEVWPLPDTARTARGALGEMYKQQAKSRRTPLAPWLKQVKR
jgi:hypothetical protein